MYFIVFIMLAHLLFQLQVVSHADCSVCSQLHTFFGQLNGKNYIQQEINKPLSIHGIKKTTSNNSILSFNSEKTICIFWCIRPSV